MMAPATCPAPGVYPGVPMAEYHAWPAASNSQLSALVSGSPAHMKAQRDAPRKETPALVMGTAIHARVLEPEAFRRTYRTAGQCVVITRGGKGDRCSRTGTWSLAGGGFVCSQHLTDDHDVDRSGIILSESDMQTVEAVGASIDEHAMAGGLIRAATEVELSVVWDDPLTGVRCKARFDAYAPSIAGGSIPDLKSAVDGGMLDFERAILRFGYHRKAWFYLRGAAAVGLEARHFPIIAVEKEPPYAVAVYRVSDGVVTYLEQQMTALLELYAECEARQHWPAYSERVREISIPDWGWKHIDNQTDEVLERLDAIRTTAKGAQAA